MRRSLISRVSGLLLAAWFAALSTELPALHSCPVHGGGASGMHAHMAPGGHGHHAAAHEPGEPTQHAAQCTCFGACCCSPSATLPTAFDAGIVATFVTGFDTPRLVVAMPLRTAPEFVLPPAIGPPAIHTSELV